MSSETICDICRRPVIRSPNIMFWYRPAVKIESPFFSRGRADICYDCWGHVKECVLDMMAVECPSCGSIVPTIDVD